MSKMAVLDGDSLGSRSSESGQLYGTALRNYPLKTVRLRRGPSRNPFGFSFRGGREFGTGFFISVVEPGSEADRKGLQVGDQIIRINGLSVEDATHREVVQLAQQHHTLTLTLSSVGLIPVKEKQEEPLTWKFVDYDSGQPPGHLNDFLTSGCDVDRIIIETSERIKLGCGICKGPAWRPGIFVQYTKPNSLARKSGLQPGDQILQCNRVSFIDIDFSYAVSVLKSSDILDLVVRKGSGIDLFPGESSGYSSSSSTTDDPVKSTLSSVPKKMEIPVPPPPRLPTTKLTTKPIKASSLNNLLSDIGPKDDHLPGSQQMLTVRQECRFGNQTVVQITGVSTDLSNQLLDNGDSPSSLSSSASLSSALSQEIQRRNEKRSRGEAIQTTMKTLQKLPEPKRQQHDLLIAELKKRQDCSSTTIQQPAPTRKTSSTKPPAPPPPPTVKDKDPQGSPPSCPTPDYSDSSTSTSSPSSSTLQGVKSSILKFEEKSRGKSVTFGGCCTREITPAKGSMESVDMKSLDGTQLTSPRTAVPKPPATYFNQQPKTTKSTVITISEYPTENKRIPGKFEFLVEKTNGGETFDNELVRTLNRSNIRNKVDERDESKSIKELSNSQKKDCHESTQGHQKPKAPQPPVLAAPQVAPLESELSHVKKTLRTFERNTGTNTIIVKIPKRN